MSGYEKLWAIFWCALFGFKFGADLPKDIVSWAYGFVALTITAIVISKTRK